MSLKWLPLLIAPALLAIACGGDGSSPTPSPTPSPSPAVVIPSPTSEPTPTPTVTPEPTVQRIAYVGPDGDVWIMNADGSGKEKLFDAKPSPFNSLISWSTDGSKFAVTERDGVVYLVTADGDTLLQVPGDRFLAWSPTGDMFAVGRFAPLAVDNAVLVLDLEGNTVVELLEAVGASFSADGARLAFFQVASEGGLYPDVRGMLAHLDSGLVLPLDPDEQPSVEIFTKGALIFSPNNPSLPAYGDRLIDLDSAEERPLPGSATSWSPDGQFLLVSCVRGFGGEVHEVETEATVLRFDLNPIPKDDTCHSQIYSQSAWSPDSRLLAVHDFGPEPDYAPGLLHIRDIATGGDTTVSVTTASFLQFSPDSAHLLFSGPGGIWLVDADGTDLTFLAEGSQPAWQPQP